MKKIASISLKIGIPLLIAYVILFFTYRDYDFSNFGKTISDLNLWWLLLALAFSLFSPIFRGLRWTMLLRSAGYNVPNSDSIFTVFTGYAANIIIPRVGEISRCAIVDRYDKVPFSKGLGTLIAERFVDMIILILMTGITVLAQFDKFAALFSLSDTEQKVVDEPVSFFCSKFFLISLSAVILLLVSVFLIRRFHLISKVKKIGHDFWLGFIAVKQVKNIPLFLFYSISIWICYYLELYLAFYCFDSISNVGALAGIVCFVASSIAVLVPTPANGAGPWHWVIISMLLIYGVPEYDAKTFALVLNTSQTACYLFGGVVGWIGLQLLHHKKQ